MAIDPLDPPCLKKPCELDKATIISMVKDLGLDTNTQAYKEAKEAVQSILRISFTPCMVNIALLADLEPKDFYRTGIEKVFLRCTHEVAMTAYAPPFSRATIYENTILDWLVQTVASDGF